MKTKFLAIALLGGAATFGLAAQALANGEPAAAAATDYAYPDFWATGPAGGQQFGTARTSGPSVGLNVMPRGRGTYLFPPNPFW